MAPFDQQSWAAKSRSIRLFVRRVFISDEFDDDLMPRYLSFVKGVVDSSDLPLNVSREILQESRITRVIRKQLIRRRSASARPAGRRLALSALFLPFVCVWARCPRAVAWALRALLVLTLFPLCMAQTNHSTPPPYNTPNNNKTAKQPPTASR